MTGRVGNAEVDGVKSPVHYWQANVNQMLHDAKNAKRKCDKYDTDKKLRITNRAE